MDYKEPATLMPFGENDGRENFSIYELKNVATEHKTLVNEGSDFALSVLREKRQLDDFTLGGTEIKLRPIGRVGIVGAGITGIELAMKLLNANTPVTIFESRRETLEAATALVRSVYRKLSLNGDLSEFACSRRIALFAGTCNFHHLKDCDLIIETLFSDAIDQEKLFRRIDEMAKPGAILAPNLISSNFEGIAGLTKRRGDVVGLRFVGPEAAFDVVQCNETLPDVLATAKALRKKLGPVSLLSKSYRY